MESPAWTRKRTQGDKTAMENRTEGTTMRQLGRADYEERRQARIDRYHERAERHGRASMEASQRAHEAVAGIPLGQPNIRGALTPAINRSRTATERSIREAEAAEYAAEKAEAAERNTAVSSDDPQALDKLREKMAKLEKVRERIKEANKLCRGKDRAAAEEALRKLGVEEKDFGEMLDGRIKGLPGWMLSGTTANIARIRKRIEAMERMARTPLPEGWEFEGGKVVIREDINRVQIVLDGRPDEETWRRLKGNGFRWARSERAWQRMLNEHGVWAAERMFPRPAAAKQEGGAE